MTLHQAHIAWASGQRYTTASNSLDQRGFPGFSRLRSGKSWIQCIKQLNKHPICIVIILSWDYTCTIFVPHQINCLCQVRSSETHWNLSITKTMIITKHCLHYYIYGCINRWNSFNIIIMAKSINYLALLHDIVVPQGTCECYCTVDTATCLCILYTCIYSSVA